MDDEIKRIDIKEFRSRGYLHEVNRLILHPLGLALEVIVNAETGDERLGGVWDYRDDPEGMCYAALDTEKAEAVAREVESRGPQRIAELGYVIQPLPPECVQLHLTIKEPTRTKVTAEDEGEAVRKATAEAPNPRSRSND